MSASLCFWYSSPGVLPFCLYLTNPISLFYESCVTVTILCYQQAGHLQSKYWGGSELRGQDLKSEQGWKDPHETFWIDNERFNVMFTKILPWGKGDLGLELANRCFKVSDMISTGSNVNQIYRCSEAC